MQRKQRLGDESLNWIKDTKGSSKDTDDSSGKPKRAVKSVKLDALKHYVSEEAEGKKVKPGKTPPLITDKSATIVKGKKQIAPKKEEAKVVKEKKVTAPEKEETKKVEAKEELISYEKIKSKTGDIIGAVKKEGAKVTETISKPISSIKWQIIKKKFDSIITASASPVKAISSIDKKINVSVRKINIFNGGNLLDNNIVKPIKDIDDKVNRAVNKILGKIL